MAAKTYEQKMAAFKNTCKNMAGVIALTAKYQISAGRPDEAGKAAAASARYAFHGFPELREDLIDDLYDESVPAKYNAFVRSVA